MYRPGLAMIATMLVVGSVNQELANDPGRNMTSFTGNAPSLAFDGTKVYLGYASKDSILFCVSDNNGKDFSKPDLVAILPGIAVGSGRGPQLIAANNNLIIAVTDKPGNVYSFIKDKNANRWEKGGRINDVAGIAKEGFVSLAAGNNGDVFAVWLDLRNDKKNKIVGARSVDGGKTWSKNKIIYSSPDGTVCECCKPSVQMKGKMVAVMFRNLLKGNRDPFIAVSMDGGLSFANAQQVGEGKWKLNACPMDGGGLAINNDNTIQTVWRREKDIYACELGKKERLLTTGKQCTMAASNKEQYIAFVNDGKVYCIKPGGNRAELGEGSSPKLTMTGSGALCAWQNNGMVLFSRIEK